jgi:hypothetical protein
MEEHPITSEVRALEGLGLEALRAEWRKRYGAPPALRSPEMLGHILAWRMQAEVFGGLEPRTMAALRKAPPKPKPTRGPKLYSGSKVAREWRGVRHEVEVLDGGFRYQGREYKSLSVIATEIAGSRWNGPRFFGLRSGASQ